MKKNLTLILLTLLSLLIIPDANAQIFGKKKKKAKAAAAAAGKKKKDKDSKIKPYKDVITKKAISDEGLFTVHKVGSKSYFELPNDLLEKEILITSRIAGFVKNLNFGGAGVRSRPQQVIRWQRMDDRILLRSVSFNSVASEEKPIYESVKNNNFEPIVAAFDIAAVSKDSSSCVIEVSDLFTKDVPMIGAVNKGQRKRFQINGLDSKRSLVSSMKAFPNNVEIKHILTYKGKNLPDNQMTETMSVEMNQSFVVLPDEPMQPRYYDERVGYFSISQTDYGSEEQRAARKRFITRWRLEPTDMEAYKRGELVEPKKQIVYYIDPATPTEWVPYLKQGVNDWAPVFEAAGFKNAIVAKEAPSKEEDPDWSPEDVRYSVIRYVSTDIQNAMGPHVHDPRTGEILESDIIWYHNVMKLLRNWFFIQTAAVNPEARTVNFKKKVMGELIRFVSAHEVGHTLGLPHNMGSSVAYAVDSLRSPTFTSTHGTAPSIMDYARFNYIAQPEDGVTDFYPNVGEYDYWSIEFGYRLLPEFNSEDAERSKLNAMVKEKAGNPLYRYGRQRGNTFDPSAQTEDLGDNSMKASRLGIKNLKRIVPKLIEWSAEDGKDYAQLDELYSNVYSQMGRYTRHVATNIGGVYEYSKTSDQNGLVYSPVNATLQRDAMKFLNEELFKTPNWLIDEEILLRIEPEGITERLRRFQVSTLNRLFQADRLKRLQEVETLSNRSGVYSLLNLFTESKNGIFSELRSGTKIDGFRRNLQRAYVDKMKDLMELKEDKYDQSDIKAMARAILKILKGEVSSASGRMTDQVSKYHLEDLVERIDGILNPK